MELVQKIKQYKILKNILYILLGSTLLIISAKIKLPFYPVPMTMQTFVVLFLGVLLGPKLAATTILFYLCEGILGLPVFSGTPEKGLGLVYFTGPTMGYLIGFMITAYLVGKFTYGKNLIMNFVKIVFATSFIYILGMFWLGTLIGWEKPIFKLGAQPFLLAELFKIMIATLAINHIKKIRKYI